MKKLFFLVVAIFFTLNVFAGDKVYVTEKGKKYHKKNCSLATGKTGIDVGEATKQGYTACTVCFKEASKEVKKDEKKAKK